MFDHDVDRVIKLIVVGVQIDCFTPVLVALADSKEFSDVHFLGETDQISTLIQMREGLTE